MVSTSTDRRRLRSDSTRAALLSAASALFAERGFAGATLDAIAEQAGVNKALIRYHFGGKQGLYSKVLQDGIDAGRALFEPVRASSAPPRERFAAYVRALCELGFSRREFVFILVREEMTGGRNIEPEVFGDFAQFFLIDREILEAGMAAGVFRNVDPHASHLSLVGSLVFFLISEPLRQARADVPASDVQREAYVRHVEELFLRGLGIDPA